MTGLDSWYGYMKSHDSTALWELLHPDVVFESPVVHTPQRGRDITFKYHASATRVLGGPNFATSANGPAVTVLCSSSPMMSMGSRSMASTSSLSTPRTASRISR